MAWLSREVVQELIRAISQPYNLVRVVVFLGHSYLDPGRVHNDDPAITVMADMQGVFQL
jgi:hypothetical protein